MSPPGEQGARLRVEDDARLRVALRVGAGLWLLLLLVGFFAPGGWTWGQAGPIGHTENYLISLWIVGLVAAPLLASLDPPTNTAALQVYLLAILAIVLSTVRAEPPKWISDAPPLFLALVTFGAVLWLHPTRSTLWHTAR